MVVAPTGLDGRPQARVVLAKEATPQGVVFFTHLDSPKGQELGAVPAATAVFWWSTMMRQVRLMGSISRLTRAEDEDYFASRPWASQIGAWASRQTRPLASREELDVAVEEQRARWGDGEVECPPYWGGFRLDVDTFEFWQGQASRLNDRVRSTRTADGWESARLQP